MAVMSLVMVSATYSVPLGPKARPVGPWMKAALLARQGKPEPMTVDPVMTGTLAAGPLAEGPLADGRVRSMRTTEHSPVAGVPTTPGARLRSSATNSDAPVGVTVAVISQGPLMSGLV